MKEIMRFVVSVQAVQDSPKPAINHNPVKLESLYVLEEMETGSILMCGRQESIAGAIGVSQQAVSLALQKGRKKIKGWHIGKKPRVYLALKHDGETILLCKSKRGEFYTMDGQPYSEASVVKDGVIDMTGPFYYYKWHKIMEQMMPSEVDDK